MLHSSTTQRGCMIEDSKTQLETTMLKKILCDSFATYILLNTKLCVNLVVTVDTKLQQPIKWAERVERIKEIEKNP